MIYRHIPKEKVVQAHRFTPFPLENHKLGFNSIDRPYRKILMPDQSIDLSGLRVRVLTPEVSTPIEQQAYEKLKKILSEHGQHISKKALTLFRQTLGRLLLHGLRVQETPNLLRFIASDGSVHEVNSSELEKAKQIDPGLKVLPAE